MGSCCEKPATPTKDTKDEDTSIDEYHEFEIGDRDGNKWIAENKKLKDRISVQTSINSQKWRVERLPDEPLWSIYLLSEDKGKLYISYDDDTEIVSLELEKKANKKRLFHILLQPDADMVIKAAGSENRFLSNNEEILEMVTTESLSNNMKWLIKESFKQIDPINLPVPLQIAEAITARKWIEHDALENAPIPVRESNDTQIWQAEYNQTQKAWTMSCQNNLFATNKIDVIYLRKVNPLVPDTTRQFILTNATSPGHMYFQTRENSKYVTAPKDEGDLFLTKKKKEATEWAFEVANIPYKDENCSLAFYPNIYK